MSTVRPVVAVLSVALAVLVILRVVPADVDGGRTGTPSELGPAPAPSWSDADWAVFAAKVRWAGEQRLDTLPLGRLIAELGRTFVGTAYVPQTLEAEGPEHIVIDFEGLDCVTLVETAFTIARFVRSGGFALMDRRGTAEDHYEALLTELRYRDGHIAGYPSRLHYFSDWIADNARRGLVRDLSAALGGVLDPEAVDFMSSHPSAYRQLADPENLVRVRETEALLNAVARLYIPEAHIAGVESHIQDGDIIAATSTVRGLDVAHTGLALWVDGRLHLLHAPLVGDSVQISETPLADRILRLEGQDGVMVARPLEG